MDYIDDYKFTLESSGMETKDYGFNTISWVPDPVQIETRIKLPDSSIKFCVTDKEGNQLEIIKLDVNGDIYVHGVVTKNDIVVVDAMREFLTHHTLQSHLVQRIKDRALEFASNEEKLMLSSSRDRAEGIRLFVKEVLESDVL